MREWFCVYICICLPHFLHFIPLICLTSGMCQAENSSAVLSVRKFGWAVLQTHKRRSVKTVSDHFSAEATHWLNQHHLVCQPHLQENFDHDHLKCGSTLDRDPIMWCSARSAHWKWLNKAAQMLSSDTWSQKCFVEMAGCEILLLLTCRKCACC